MIVRILVDNIKLRKNIREAIPAHPPARRSATIYFHVCNYMVYFVHIYAPHEITILTITILTINFSPFLVEREKVIIIIISIYINIYIILICKFHIQSNLEKINCKDCNCKGCNLSFPDEIDIFTEDIDTGTGKVAVTITILTITINGFHFLTLFVLQHVSIFYIVADVF